MGSRILVIEDNPTNLELMTYLLKAFGHTTITAKDGEEGVAAALASKPDLILCDLALPKLDERSRPAHRRQSTAAAIHGERT